MPKLAVVKNIFLDYSKGKSLRDLESTFRFFAFHMCTLLSAGVSYAALYNSVVVLPRGSIPPYLMW